MFPVFQGHHKAQPRKRKSQIIIILLIHKMGVFESEIYQVLVKLLDGKHKTFNFSTPSISVLTLKHHIQTLTFVPSHLQVLLSSNSRILYDNQSLVLDESCEITRFPESPDFNSNDQLSQDQNLGVFYDSGFPENRVVYDGSGGFQYGSNREAGKFPVVVHLLLRLRGGKGGFGSLLRGAATKAGQKKTNNFDACRDMSGRRLRHVNAEKKLEEWRAESDERKLERMAEEYIKKKAKEAAKNGKSKVGNTAEKYVAKYREDSAKCMEEVERSVRESIKGLVSSKRKVGTEEGQSNSKRLKIWLGKRKLGDSDSDSDSEDMIGDDSGKDEREENEKSVVTDNGNLSDSSKEAEGTSDSLTNGKFFAGSLDRGSSGSQEEDIVAAELPKSVKGLDGFVVDGKDKNKNKSALENLKGIIDHNGAEMKVPHKSPSIKWEEMVSQLPCVSGPGDVVTPADVSNVTISEPVPEVSECMSSKVQNEHTNFDEYNSAADLEVLGMERLKSELQTRGLKCGGTLQERAARLFLLKTIPLEMLPKKLFARK